MLEQNPEFWAELALHSYLIEVVLKYYFSRIFWRWVGEEQLYQVGVARVWAEITKEQVSASWKPDARSFEILQGENG